MKQFKGSIFYLLFFISVVLIDRVTKYWALHYLDATNKLNEFISFDFTLNRGISWGMFHSENEGMFYLVTLVVIGVTLFLISFAYRRWQDAELILGELLVIAGAVSNIIDRIMYRGVIDFIVISFKGWSFPAIFNVADVCIVFGIFLMVFSVYKERRVS
jgi:signal peptidase II